MSKKYILLSIAVHLFIVGFCFRSRPLDIIRKTNESMRIPIQYVDNLGVIDSNQTFVQKIEVKAPRASEIELIVEAYGIPVEQLL